MNNVDEWNWIKEISLIKDQKKLSIPFNIFLKEASEISGFIEKYWETAADRPGLCAAMPVIEAGISREIDALVAEIARLSTEVAKTETSPRRTGVSLEARQWLREMHHLLKWAYRYPAAEKIPSANVPALIREYRRKSKNAAALAQWINANRTLVRMYPDEFSHVPGLTPAFLAAGEAIEQALRDVRRGRSAGSAERRAAMKQRDALLHILQDRITRVRTAVRFVFRNHPQIRKLAMSDFERRRRSKNRQKSEKGATT